MHVHVFVSLLTRLIVCELSPFNYSICGQRFYDTIIEFTALHWNTSHNWFDCLTFHSKWVRWKKNFLEHRIEKEKLKKMVLHLKTCDQSRDFYKVQYFNKIKLNRNGQILDISITNKSIVPNLNSILQAELYFCFGISWMTMKCFAIRFFYFNLFCCCVIFPN